MSIDPFPAHVTPRKLCNRNGAINSTIPLGKLLRLSEYLDDTQGQAEVCLSFTRDEAGHCVIKGSAKAGVSMLCQRCLEPVLIPLSLDMELKVAEDEREAERISAGSADPLDKLEIVICEDGQLDLLSLIEDELIMSLPIVAAHEDEKCSKALTALKTKARELDKVSQGNVTGLEALAALKQELSQNKDSK